MHGNRSSPLEHFNRFVGSECFPANAKVIFLTAPERESSRTKDKGLAWYDNIGKLGKMKDFSPEFRAKLFNQEQMVEQTDRLIALIKNEAETQYSSFGVSGYSKIFISGHSMGCKMAMSLLLRYNLPSPLGGIIGISGSIALTEDRMTHDTEIAQ